MKTKSTLVMILCLIGLFSKSIAQYKPLLNNGSEWITYHWFEASETGFVVIEGDSLINGIQYKKILSTIYGGGFTSTLLREDTLSKQVFERISNTTEKLLYDFSLLPGDTFYRGQTVMILDSFSTVLNSNGGCVSEDNPVIDISDPKVFYFSTNNQTLYSAIWVEGIGSLAGLLLSNFDWGGGNLGETLLCHFTSPGERDYHYVYCEEPDDCLGPIISTKELQAFETLSISPNPVVDELRIAIQTPEIQIQRIFIYNALGALESVQEVRAKSFTADVSKHSKGLLYLLVELSNGQKLSSKVIRL